MALDDAAELQENSGHGVAERKRKGWIENRERFRGRNNGYQIFVAVSGSQCLAR